MKPTLNPEDAFVAYCAAVEAAGTERGACAAVAKRFEVPRSTITRMAARYRFSQRLAGEVAPIVRQKTNEIAATSAAEWRAEAARVGSELVRRGFEALERAQLMGTKEALDAIKLGATLCDRATEPKQKQVNVDVRHILESRFQKLVEQRPQVPAPAPRITVDFGDLDDDEGDQ